MSSVITNVVLIGLALLFLPAFTFQWQTKLAHAVEYAYRVGYHRGAGHELNEKLIGSPGRDGETLEITPTHVEARLASKSDSILRLSFDEKDPASGRASVRSGPQSPKDADR